MFSSHFSPSYLILWYPWQSTRELSLCVGCLLQASATLRDGGGSALGSRLSKQKSSAPLQRLWTTVVDELPSGHSKGGGFSSAALEGSAALPSGTDPRTGQEGADPRTGTLKREKCFCPGVLSSSLSWPACARAFLVPGRWVSPALPPRFPVCFVPPDVSFYWPRASRSSSQREGRRVKLRKGADPRTGFFSGITLYAVCFHFLSYVRGSIPRVWSRVLGHGRRFHSQVCR